MSATASSPPAAGQSAARYPFGKVMIAFAVAYVIAAVLNYAVWWVVTGPLGVESNFGPYAMPAFIAIYTGLFLFVAAVIFWLLAKRSADVPAMWRQVALIGLIVSLIPNVAAMFGMMPPVMGTMTPAANLGLVTMHVLSYLVARWVFPRYGRA